MVKIEVCTENDRCEVFNPVKDDMLVFVDALRTSNTVIAMIHSGAAKVIPVSDLDEARRMAGQRQESNYVFVGERGGKKLDFCDYGNSPSEIIGEKEKIKGKTAVITTTNFTRIFERYRKYDCCKVVGSLANLSSIKSFISSGKEGSVFLIPAGKKGKRAPEDHQTALYMKDYLCGGTRAEEVPDMLSRTYYESESGSNLRVLGYENDVDLCLKLNQMNIVPVFKDGYFAKSGKNGK
jgi:2-phosphosulfolactate phosphatase